MNEPSPTVTDRLLQLASVDEHGIRFGDRYFSWREHVQLSADRTSMLNSKLDPSRPRHVGVLLDNCPEFSFLIGAASFSGSVVVGLNSTRRGAALARDIALGDCQFVLTQSRLAPLLDGLDLGGREVVDIESARWTELLAEHVGSPVTTVPTTPDDLLMLVLTSGTSGDPKAVRCNQFKVCYPGIMLADRFRLTPEDTVYLSMPMFHSNSIMAGWSVGLAAGSDIAIRPKFSASEFLSDVRRYGVRYANYVGKPLAYVLNTPPQPDDADNPLRLMYGNEGSARVVEEFSKRFGVMVLDAFGSSEGGIAISPDPNAPPGAMGLLPANVAILDPVTDEPCPPAEFDADGSVSNSSEAIGELVNISGSGDFAGYYNNPEANAERLRGGKFHSGDLAYRDSDGYVYFAGRSGGWLRVDGENLATGPIERILLRCPVIGRAAVYSVPDPDSGDRVMAAIVPTGDLDATTFAEFLAEQSDLGPKQIPTYVRICTDLPQTATFKVLTRTLQHEGIDCADPVWVRSGAGYSPRPSFVPNSTFVPNERGAKH